MPGTAIVLETSFELGKVMERECGSVKAKSGRIPNFTPAFIMRTQLLYTLVACLSVPFTCAAQLPMPPLPIEVGETTLSSGEPTLFDRLVIERRASIFSDYVRNSREISSRLSDRNAKTTVLVPTNHAVLALPRKP